jgi:uncharacterized protein
MRSTAEIIRALKGHTRFPSRVHGPAHWARVHRFGCLLAEKEGLPMHARTCVELFAWTHDLAREDDGGGNEHAIQGATYIDEVLPAVFGSLPADQVEILRIAIRYHSDGLVAAEVVELGLVDGVGWSRDLAAVTVGCCWDADRLDLLRFGIQPVAPLMSTASWRDVMALAVEVHQMAAGEGNDAAAPVLATATYDPRLGARFRRAAEERESPGVSSIEIRAPRRNDPG